MIFKSIDFCIYIFIAVKYYGLFNKYTFVKEMITTHKSIN